MTFVLPFIVMVIYLKGYYDMFYDKGMKYFIPWMSVAVLILCMVVWLAFGKQKRKDRTHDSIQ